MTREEYDRMVATGVAPCGCKTTASADRADADGLMRSTDHTDQCTLRQPVAAARRVPRH